MTEETNPTWPRPFPVYRLLGLVLSLPLGILFLRLWLLYGATPLDRFYFPAYARITLLPTLPSLPKPDRRSASAKPYPVVFFGPEPATDDMLQRPHGPLRVRYLTLLPSDFAAWLRRHIYGGRNVFEVLEWPLLSFCFSFILLLIGGSYGDHAHNREARNGRRLRGPGLVSRWGFNRRTKGDGLCFRLTNRRNLLEWLQPGPSGKDLVIRRDREAHHIQIAGDTGTGKSTLVRQIIHQVEGRGEVAIIFDPDREYIQEFFNEKRGDWVLNPKDERCPYWPIGEEADDEAEATPVAMGLFPDAPTRQQFFLSHTRAIFAYLLATYKPTVSELAHWMAHPKEIDKRVKGTEHEHTLTVNAAPQRAGILGSLNEAGKPLRMMPTRPDGRRRWTVRDWANDRRGWLFITSTPNTIDALRPMQSLWLDMLILALQSDAGDLSRPRVWLILDELSSVNALPQLLSAMTKQRKSGNPIVLGFQSMAQVADAYGDKKAETILSQAFTNIALRTREPRAAEHLSKLIGKAQLERARESKPARWFQGRYRSYSSERVIDPVVMDSELQGLDDLNGYFIQQDKVVAMEFKPQPRRKVAVGLIERLIPAGRQDPLGVEDPPIAALPNKSEGSPVAVSAQEIATDYPEGFSMELLP